MMGTVTITEFLLARIAEQEARLDDMRRSKAVPNSLLVNLTLRVAFADCEAKRRIVEEHSPIDDQPNGWCTVCDGDGWPCATMAALASVYADHSDFDPAWRVAD